MLWQRAKLCMARAARWGQDDDLEELRDCVAHLGAGGGSSSPVLVSKLAVFRLQGSDYIAHRAGPGSKAEWQVLVGLSTMRPVGGKVGGGASLVIRVSG